MADQEFLASFGVDIDENGVSRLQQILTENKALGDSLAASFNAAAEGVKAFKESISTELPSLFSNGYGNVTENLFGSDGGLKIGLNMTEPKKEIASFTADAKKPIPLSANASAIVSAARTALENVRSLFSETFILNVRANTTTTNSSDDSGSRNDSRNKNNTGSTYQRMSTGGRFTRPTDVQVAEDGDAEYIIPVKKEGRALPLIRQLLSELSPEARQSLIPAAQEPEPEVERTETASAQTTDVELQKSPVQTVFGTVPDPEKTTPASVAVPKAPAEKLPVPNVSVPGKQETVPQLSNPVPIQPIRETFSEADLPLAPVPAAEKKETPEPVAPVKAQFSGSEERSADSQTALSALMKELTETGKELISASQQIAVPVPSSESEDKPADHETGLSALLKELAETGKELISASQPNIASVQSSGAEDRPADQQIGLSALLKEFSETGKELISASQPNTAPLPDEKELAPQFSVPDPKPVEKEPALQFPIPIPMPAEKDPAPQPPVPSPKSAEKESVLQLSSLIPAPVEKETVPQLPAPAPMSVEKEPVPQFPAPAPMPVAKEDISSLSASAPLPAIRETFAEADHPLAPAPTTQAETLPSGSVAQQESVSDLITRLSSVMQPAGNTVNNTSNNLSAPVTINVKAMGSDAEQIGETIYNTAERYLLRTMKGAFA